MAEQQRIIMRVEITPAARSTLVGVLDQFGMTQVAVMSKLMKWMVEQDDVTQAMILGVYPVEGETTAAERAMKKIAKGQ